MKCIIKIVILALATFSEKASDNCGPKLKQQTFFTPIQNTYYFYSPHHSEAVENEETTSFKPFPIQ